MKRRGFTLAEMMTVVAIVGMLSTISLSQVGRASRQHRETLLRARLEVVRGALERVYVETGVVPRNLADLTVHTPPADGFLRNPDGSHTRVAVPRPGTWRGPYLSEIPLDPMNNAAFLYTPWEVAPSLMVRSNSPSTGTDGRPYTQW